MRIAVISDIHANLPALKSVLEDVRGRGVDRILCAGDLVGYAPFPNEVISLIRDSVIESVLGNYDDGVGFERGDCGCAYRDDHSRELGKVSIAWTTAEVTSENKAFLRSLPPNIVIEAAGRRVMLVHGSPRKINEYLYEDRPEATLKRVIEASGADVVICGHTHIPYHKVIDDKHLINAGSVGKPKHGRPNALYALIDLGDGVQVTFVEVPYDVEITARAIENSELPNDFARLLREGRG